ncbi:type IV secretion system DNA-binding domain-containing protein [Dactylosporangium sp. AC04546]|uniref:type IV secretion system DNA-binding domain-containing protein n=1 Tax=Dactylosporangium sp. AC04546 TaxID=2862460 RepID=UPI001EDCFE80|nr:type IV secretion system DNA-binding domain-containing protein [Dactylosporangium sp. AC04546]WVK78937.1 type IV secretion system DNA-binding domain-containing protein [Dactylosporangium sp. AC04546]
MVARPWLAVAAVVAVVAAVLGWEQVLAWRHRRFAAGARWVRIAAPPEVDPRSAAALWVAMAGVLTPGVWRRRWFGIPHVAWEYTWTGRTLTIRLWVPGTVPVVAVQAAIHAAWPASTTTVEDHTGPPIPLDVAAQTGGAWWPHDPDVVPLRTDHDTDPLRPTLAAGADIGHREHACVQILARPADRRRVRRAIAAAAPSTPPAGGVSQLAHWGGAGAVDAVARLAAAPIQWLLDVVLPGSTRRTTAARSAGATRTVRHPLVDARQRAVADKAGRTPHFEIAVRYAVAADATPHRPGRPGRPASQQPAGSQPESRHADERRQRPQDDDRHRQRLAGLAHAFAAAAATYTRPNRLRRIPMPHPAAALAGRRLRHGFLATVEELATLAALPQDLAVPGLDRARAKAMPAPAAIPAGGRDVKVLGRAQTGGRSVGLHAVDARQHVHLIGKTGVGKSTLLLNMILADVHARRGAVVIDPRGDLVLDILDRLPANYADRVAIIDPDQPNPACFNPLDDSGDPHLAVDNLVGVFSKIFQRHWGPRIDDTLRVSCLTLMRHANPTLALVPPLLNDRAFRSRFVHDLSDPEGLGGFWAWYDSMNEGMRAQVIGPVLARLRAFLLRDFVKDVIGTAHSTLHMSQILDGGLLLCRLPKGQLGEETARILGSLIVARTWQAAIARAGQPEQQRRDATLYIDEVQNFLNLPGSVEDILSEARGFRLGLVLAHQNLGQLPAATASAISANARSKIYFNVDPLDARDLARHTRPELDEHDLAHLDVHTAAARLLVSNRELPAFTFTTNPPPAPVGEATAIRQAVAAARTRTAGDTAMQQLARRGLHRRPGGPAGRPTAPQQRRSP